MQDSTGQLPSVRKTLRISISTHEDHGSGAPVVLIHGYPLSGVLVDKETEMIRLDTRACTSALVLLLFSCVTPTEAPMAAQTGNLYLLENLDDASETRQLTNSDLAALRAVADWIKSFVARPHKELGRDGPVCPFVPEAVQRKTLWLASEHIAGRSVADVVQLMNGYKTQFRHTQPMDGDGANNKVIVVVFTDLPADRARALFGEVLQQLAVPSYVEDGVLFGPFYEGNSDTAIYNLRFRPFQSPVPLLFVRHGVISDWKFFLDNDEWLNRWAHRYGESGVRPLAEELRRLPWRRERRRVAEQEMSCDPGGRH
jgi:hypothetical protein